MSSLGKFHFWQNVAIQDVVCCRGVAQEIRQVTKDRCVVDVGVVVGFEEIAENFDVIKCDDDDDDETL